MRADTIEGVGLPSFYAHGVLFPLHWAEGASTHFTGMAAAALSAPARLDHGVAVTAKGLETNNWERVVAGLGESTAASAEIAGTVVGAASAGQAAASKLKRLAVPAAAVCRRLLKSVQAWQGAEGLAAQRGMVMVPFVRARAAAGGGGSVGAMRLVTFGKNAPIKLRKHSQHIRETARRLGIEIPKGPGKPATRQAMEDFITRVAARGETTFGRYMTYPEAQWSRLGDAVVVRQMDGTFITFLDATKGGVVTWIPGGL